MRKIIARYLFFFYFRAKREKYFRGNIASSWFEQKRRMLKIAEMSMENYSRED